MKNHKNQKFKENATIVEDGLVVIKNRKNAGPGPAFLLIHDMLEHESGDITVENELQAVGAFFYVRYLGGYLETSKGKHQNSEALSEILKSIIEPFAKNKKLLDQPQFIMKEPKISGLNWVKKAAAMACELIATSYGDVGVNKQLNVILQHIYLGYYNSVKRYKGLNSNKLSKFFTKAETYLQETINAGTPGDIISVDLNPWTEKVMITNENL